MNLSNREKQVLGLISLGYTATDIGKQIYLSPHTVISHKKKMMRELNAKNIAHLVRIGFEKGLISAPIPQFIRG